jgi:hypothetical protein
MFTAKKLTTENFHLFFGTPKNMFASYAILVRDGGTEYCPKGRRMIYMVTRRRGEFAVISEYGDIKLTGRSIGELVRAHSDGYTFFYIEITQP